MFFSSYVYAGTDVTDPITTPTYWSKANSPYYLNGSITIEQDGVLVIEAGTRVEFGYNFYLFVYGELRAIGTNDDPIVFTSYKDNPPSVWKDILFKDSSKDAEFDNNGNYLSGCILENCIIEYGRIRIQNASPFINKNTFRYSSDICLYTHGMYSKSVISNNNFVDNEDYGIYTEGCIGLQIIGNVFTNNSLGAIHVNGGYVKNAVVYITSNQMHNNKVGIITKDNKIKTLDIVSNNIYDNDGGIILEAYCENIKIEKNNIYDNDINVQTFENPDPFGEIIIIPAEKNWWGQSNSNMVENIIDYYDNIFLSKLDIDPVVAMPYDDANATEENISIYSDLDNMLVDSIIDICVNHSSFGWGFNVGEYVIADFYDPNFVSIVNSIDLRVGVPDNEFGTFKISYLEWAGEWTELMTVDNVGESVNTHISFPEPIRLKSIRVDMLSGGGTDNCICFSEFEIYGTYEKVINEGNTNINTNFIDNNDGTITDIKTNLMWEKFGNKNTVIWDEAVKYCEELRLNGYTNWRLPTMEELTSIGCADYSPAIDPAFDILISVWHWPYWTDIDGRVRYYWDMTWQGGNNTYAGIRAVRTNDITEDVVEISIVEEIDTTEDIVEVPIEEVEIPVEEVDATEDVIEDPVEEVEIPVEEVDATEDVIESPIEEIVEVLVEEIIIIKEVIEEVKIADVPIEETVVEVIVNTEEVVEETHNGTKEIKDNQSKETENEHSKEIKNGQTNKINPDIDSTEDEPLKDDELNEEYDQLREDLAAAAQEQNCFINTL